MLVTVRHLPREEHRKISCLYNEERSFYALDQLKHNNYFRVADIEIQEGEDYLETAYKLTQSTDYPWYLNQNLEIVDEFKDGCRSTSVGDIIQIRGVSFMVDSFGFTELKEK